ncbi:hypothetical protein BMS3Abin03_00339 [bacterium BMS3Abin03]|nr:hypothetical protein BMS3Abin03_00339 [bacterium BMS3Abin03]
MSLKIFKMVFPIVLGATGGYLYYFYVGCSTMAAQLRVIHTQAQHTVW